MATENHDELLWAIDEESAELDNLTKQREELEKDVAQMQNEYKDELKKKLQAIKDNKNKEKEKINNLMGTRIQLTQVFLKWTTGYHYIFPSNFSSVIYNMFNPKTLKKNCFIFV